MADTTFINRATNIQASWLNDVNSAVYKNAVDVRFYGAQLNGTNDDTAAFQAAINTGKPVLVGPGNAKLSATLIPVGSGELRLIGAGSQFTTLTAAPGFTGYMISPTGRYNIEGFTIQGLLTDGVYGIGTNAVNSGGGRGRLYDIKFFNFDQAVNFGPEYEHPLGLDYDRVYVQGVRTCGINLGGRTGVASSGESAFDFGGSVICTNALQNGISYSSSVQVNTPDTTHDTITWTDSGNPEFGYVVMRSANGTTGWHVPPNWSSLYYGTLSFVAQKGLGETWTYAVVRQTVGINIRRAKAVAGGAVQAEYFGIGIRGDDVKALDFQSTYYENRDVVPPRPAFAAVAFTNSFPIKIETAWAEECGYGIFFSSNSRGSIKGMRASNLAWAAIGNTGSTDQVVNYENIVISGTTPAIYRSPTGNANDFSYFAQEYTTGEMIGAVSHTTMATQELRFRGTSKSRWSYNNTNGSTLTLNSAAISPFAKTQLAPTNQMNTALVTLLTNNVATAFLSFDVTSNTAATLTFAVSVVVVDGSSVARQVAGGLLVISATSAAGSIAAGVNSTVATALQAGTLTGPTFTTSVAGSTVTVLANANSNQAGTLRLTLTPISVTGSAIPTSITQA